MTAHFSRQNGMSLLVSLIMLVLITLVTLTSFKLSKGSLQIAGNQQQRAQTMTATQGAIEQVISDTKFAVTPNNAVPRPCNNQANTACTDVNGDGVADIKVAITSSCISAQVIPVTLLDFTQKDDAGCLVGVSGNAGIAGAISNNSLCSNMLWDVQGVGADTINNAQYVINQGAAVRVSSTTVCP